MNAEKAAIVLKACVENMGSLLEVKKQALFNHAALALGVKLDNSINILTGSLLRCLWEAGLVVVSKKTCRLTAAGGKLVKNNKHLVITEKELFQRVLDKSPSLKTMKCAWEKAAEKENAEPSTADTLVDPWDHAVLSLVDKASLISLKDMQKRAAESFPADLKKGQFANKLQNRINQLVQQKYLASKKKNEGPYQLTPTGKAYLTRMRKLSGILPEKAPAQKPSFQLGEDKLLELTLLMTVKHYPGISHHDINTKLYSKLTGKQKTQKINESDPVLRMLEQKGFVTLDKKGWYSVSESGKKRITELEQHTTISAASAVPTERVMLDGGIEDDRPNFIQHIMDCFVSKNGQATHSEVNDYLYKLYQLPKKIQLSKATVRELTYLVDSGYLTHEAEKPYVLTSQEGIPTGGSDGTSDNATMVSSMACKCIPSTASIPEPVVVELIADRVGQAIPAEEIRPILNKLVVSGCLLRQMGTDGVLTIAVNHRTPDKLDSMREYVLQALPATHDQLMNGLPDADEPRIVDLNRVISEMEKLGIVTADRFGVRFKYKDDPGDAGYINLLTELFDRANSTLEDLGMSLDDARYKFYPVSADNMGYEYNSIHLPDSSSKKDILRILESMGMVIYENLSQTRVFLNQAFYRHLCAANSIESGLESWVQDAQSREALLHRIQGKIAAFVAVDPNDIGYVEVDDIVGLIIEKDCSFNGIKRYLENEGFIGERTSDVTWQTIQDLISSMEKEGFLSVKKEDVDGQEKTMAIDSGLCFAWRQEYCGGYKQESSLPIRGNDTISFEMAVLLILESLAVDMRWTKVPQTVETLQLFVTMRLSKNYDYLSNELTESAIQYLEKLGLVERNQFIDFYDEYEFWYFEILPTDEAIKLGKAIHASRLASQEPQDVDVANIMQVISWYPALMDAIQIAYQDSVVSEDCLSNDLLYDCHCSAREQSQIVDWLKLRGYLIPSKEDPEKLTCSYKAVLVSILRLLNEMEQPRQPVVRELQNTPEDRTIIQDALIQELVKSQPQTKEDLIQHVQATFAGTYTVSDDLITSVTYSMRTGAFDRRMLTRTNDTKLFTLAALGIDRLLSLKFGEITEDGLVKTKEAVSVLQQPSLRVDSKPDGKLMRAMVLHALAYGAVEHGMRHPESELKETVMLVLTMIGYTPDQTQLDEVLTGFLEDEMLVVNDGHIELNKKRMNEAASWYQSALEDASDCCPQPCKPLLVKEALQYIVQQGKKNDQGQYMVDEYELSAHMSKLFHPGTTEDVPYAIRSLIRTMEGAGLVKKADFWVSPTLVGMAMSANMGLTNWTLKLDGLKKAESETAEAILAMLYKTKGYVTLHEMKDNLYLASRYPPKTRSWPDPENDNARNVLLQAGLIQYDTQFGRYCLTNEGLPLAAALPEFILDDPEKKLACSSQEEYFEFLKKQREQDFDQKPVPPEKPAAEETPAPVNPDPVPEPEPESEPAPVPASEPEPETEADSAPAPEVMDPAPVQEVPAMGELVGIYRAAILQALYSQSQDGEPPIYDREVLLATLPTFLSGAPISVLDEPLTQLTAEGMVQCEGTSCQLTGYGKQMLDEMFNYISVKPLPSLGSPSNRKICGYFALRKVPRPMVAAIYDDKMLKTHNQKYSLQSHWTFQPHEREKALKWAGTAEVYLGNEDANYDNPIVLDTVPNTEPNTSILSLAKTSPIAYSTLYVHVVRLLAKGMPMRFEAIRNSIVETLHIADVSLEKASARISWIISYLGSVELVETGNPSSNMVLMTTKGQNRFHDTSDNGIIRALMDYPFFRNVSNDLSAYLSILNTVPSDSDMELRLEHNELQFKAMLLERMHNMDPFDFEVLILLLIQKMGYGEMVPNKIDPTTPGDEGVDGMIRCDEFGLHTIYTQAKRWSSNNLVSRPEVQKFVGALEGKNCSEGIFITTSSFSAAAVDYVNQLGRFKVILVDGDKLADLMIKYKLGFTERPSFVYREFDESWWKSLKDLY